mmetsp:Transcript_38144/g.107798  ORF Transcript_38144/g.107798 Transcript_38144/m.107798 type:complete len:207 (-) Transcript_38144:643-1263(-)
MILVASRSAGRLRPEQPTVRAAGSAFLDGHVPLIIVVIFTCCPSHVFRDVPIDELLRVLESGCLESSLPFLLFHRLQASLKTNPWALRPFAQRLRSSGDLGLRSSGIPLGGSIDDAVQVNLLLVLVCRRVKLMKHAPPLLDLSIKGPLAADLRDVGGYRVNRPAPSHAAGCLGHKLAVAHVAASVLPKVNLSLPLCDAVLVCFIGY